MMGHWNSDRGRLTLVKNEMLDSFIHETLPLTGLKITLRDKRTKVKNHKERNVSCETIGNFL